jgi:phytol kinase
MEDEATRTNLGTIYFPISLLVLVLLSFAGPMPVFVAGIGILILGYGDGLASLVGRKLKSRTFAVFGGCKSVAGTLTMLVFSALVTAVFTHYFNPSYSAFGGEIGGLVAVALITAAAATAIEFLTPYGVDNLTVPIVTALFYNGVFV